jgi:hypothetical protein
MLLVLEMCRIEASQKMTIFAYRLPRHQSRWLQEKNIMRDVKISDIPIFFKFSLRIICSFHLDVTDVI